MDKYTAAVTSIPCPRVSCGKPVGEVCLTSSVVHNERREEVIKLGLWDPEKAYNGE